ncbi:MAG: thiamine phosphate synthase [Clostridia bacterium]|nr:thiamine phosphate synthase [Clostridia bacterium]
MKCDKKSLLLYAVTDRTWLNGESLYEQVEKAIKGGATVVQLREKNLDEESLLSEALEIQALCKKYKIPFIINDHVEIAKKINADGVHVGQSDGKAENIRAMLGDEKILGVSAQTVEQALLAEKAGADYLGVGAVFPTGSKPDADDVSFDTLKEICSAVSIPVVAIGGISAKNAEMLKNSGISGIAVISAIFAAEDIESATKILRKLSEKVVS